MTNEFNNKIFNLFPQNILISKNYVIITHIIQLLQFINDKRLGNNYLEKNIDECKAFYTDDKRLKSAPKLVHENLRITLKNS